MPDSIKCSIIIPVYNGEAFLKETLKSCLSQDIGLNHLEIILIDDNSQDSSPSIIRSFTKSTPIMKAVHNEQNQGMIASVNYGASIATGEYLLFLGQDDLLPTHHLTRMIAAFTDKTAMVHCNAFTIDKNGRKTGLSASEFSRKKKDLFSRFYITISNSVRSTGAVIRRRNYELTGGWDPQYRNYGEWLLWIKLFATGTVKYTDKTRAFYRRHDNNLSKTFSAAKKKQLYADYNQTCRNYALKTLHSGIGRSLMKGFLKLTKRA